MQLLIIVRFKILPINLQLNCMEIIQIILDKNYYLVNLIILKMLSIPFHYRIASSSHIILSLACSLAMEVIAISPCSSSQKQISILSWEPMALVATKANS